MKIDDDMEGMGINIDNKQDVSLGWLLFGTEGRLTRKPYWLFVLTNFILSVILSVIVVNTDNTITNIDNTTMSLMDFVISIISIGLAIASIVACICVGIKRSHDRGRSGWFVLLGFVPILCLWPFIELGFFRGTIGDNKYGKDPLLHLSMYYQQAGQEIVDNSFDKDLWMKALINAKGNGDLQKIEYIKLRAKQLASGSQ